MLPMDDTDREILNRIQSDFPITPRPFRRIAADLGLEEADVMERLVRLKKEGIIRRIGGNFVPDKMGYVSTLCAAKVPDDRIDEFAKIVNRFTGVTHNYVRHGEYNVWFTFIAPSRDIIQQHLDAISKETGIPGILNLPATKVFKIKAQFEL